MIAFYLLPDWKRRVIITVFWRWCYSAVAAESVDSAGVAAVESWAVFSAGVTSFSAGVAVVSAGATVSTGAAHDTLAILLEANTLLTDTITNAAIAANTNFFIIVMFLICEYIILFISLLWSALCTFRPLFCGIFLSLCGISCLFEEHSVRLRLRLNISQ